MREARRYLDIDLALDAAQETMLRAWRRASTCLGPPEPWVRAIARHEALRIAGRRIAGAIAEDWELGEGPTDSYLVDQRLDLTRALARLSHDERHLLFLRYWAGQTEKEIASALEAPIGTVKVRLHRARTKLAQRLGRDNLGAPTVPTAGRHGSRDA